jgi:hypothetical protein
MGFDAGDVVAFSGGMCEELGKGPLLGSEKVVEGMRCGVIIYVSFCHPGIST